MKKSDLVEMLDKIDGNLNIVISVDVSTGEKDSFDRAFGDGLIGMQSEGDGTVTILTEGTVNFNRCSCPTGDK